MLSALLLAAACLPDPAYTMTPTLKWDFPYAELADPSYRVMGFRVYLRLAGGTSWLLATENPCPFHMFVDELGATWYDRTCAGAVPTGAPDLELASPSEYVVRESLSLAVQRYTGLEGDVVEWGVKAYRYETRPGIIEPVLVESLFMSNVVGICQPPVCDGWELPTCTAPLMAPTWEN